MRLGGLGLVALLAASLMSYGLVGNSYADTHNIPPISATAELPSYERGDPVVVDGSIRDYDPDEDNIPVIIKIIGPNGALIEVDQVLPDSDGTFTYSTVAGPLWKVDGDYTVEFFFGSNSGSTVVVFTAPEVAPPPPEPITCGPNQDLVNGVCIDRPPPPPPEPITCGPNQDLVNGVCIDRPPPPPPEPITCGPNQDLIDGVCIDKPPEPVQPECGPGTEMVDGVCIVIPPTVDDNGGCLIATAAYGSELAPQVQFLREIRDNTVMSTESGTAFMAGFNQLYYSFSPAIADMERESPEFKSAVRALITPMLATLSIMTLADAGSEAHVLGLGISVIMLNLGMYVAAPALAGYGLHRHVRSKNTDP